MIVIVVGVYCPFSSFHSYIYLDLPRFILCVHSWLTEYVGENDET